MTRAAILAHLKETGPANSRTVAKALGFGPRWTLKQLSEMKRLGLLSGEGKPVQYGYLRDPVSQEERLRRARAVLAQRPKRGLDHARALERSRKWLEANREAVNAKRRARDAAKRAVTPRKVKPHTVAIRKATAASSAAAVERKQAGAPRVESATRPTLPDTGAFIAANPHLVERLPMDAPWRSFEKPRLSDREKRLLNGPALDDRRRA